MDISQNNLSSFKKDFERVLKKDIKNFEKRTLLSEACEYSLINQGKRIRPLIVCLMFQALKAKHIIWDVSLCVEYFHTASLIADDLPSMDNDDFRRNKPSLHVAFGEGVSILASYALISYGYQKIVHAKTFLLNTTEHSTADSNKIGMLALDLVSNAAGISGAVGGQYCDVFLNCHTSDEVLDIMYKKTATLFEMSFSLGWLFGGGDIMKVDKIKEVGVHFGMCFQVLDDILDSEQDKNHSKNLVNMIGRSKSLAIFEKEKTQCIEKMKKLGIFTHEFFHLMEALSSRIGSLQEN